jgi:hypothetical protein
MVPHETIQSMKYILFLLIEAGSGVASVDRMAAMSAEFDDQQACHAAVQWFAKNSNRTRPAAICLPKATAVESKKPEAG